MKFNDKLITAIAAIVVGVLFIALKGDVLYCIYCSRRSVDRYGYSGRRKKRQ